MSKASKAKKEKFNRKFNHIPVAQRKAYIKEYYSPEGRAKRLMEHLKNSYTFSISIFSVL